MRLSEITEKIMNKEVMKNQYGDIPVGAKVMFEVENQSCWAGELSGTLSHNGDDFVIDTNRSGRLTINKGYDVYSNTIRPC